MTYQGGEAVLDYSPLRQQAYRTQQLENQRATQERKAQELSAKQAADLTAKINPNGLRDADIPQFTKMYDSFKKLAIGVANAGSVQERAQASSRLQSALTDIQLLINSSKNRAGNFKEIGTRISSNPARVTQQQRDRFLSLNNTPTEQLDNIDFQTEFRLGARPEIFTNTNKTIYDALGRAAQDAQKLTRTGTLSENGRTKAIYQNRGSLPLQNLLDGYQSAYQTNSEYKQLWDEKAAQEGVDVATAMLNEANRNKQFLEYRSGSTFQDVTPRKSSGDGDVATSFGAPTVREFTGTPSGTQDVRRFISPQFIPYNGGTISTPQLRSVFSITEGKTQPTVSLKNAEVTGIGYFPRVVNGKQVVGKGITVSAQNEDKDVIEYFISEEKIPVDFKGKKVYKAADKALGQFQGSTSQTQNRVSSPAQNTNITKRKVSW